MKLKHKHLAKEILIEFKSALTYFLLYFAELTAGEVLIRFFTQPGNVFGGFGGILLFILPLSAFFTFLSGHFRRRKVLNNVLFLLLTFIITVYYISQVLYYNTFGSLFSVSLIKMGGEAVTNFGWAFKSVLISTVPVILLCLIPLFVFIILLTILAKKTGKYLPYTNCVTNVIVLVLVVIFSTMGVIILKAAGTNRGTAYYVLTNSYSDTDSSAQKLGALTTTCIESGVYYLNVKIGDSQPSGSVDYTALELITADMEGDGQAAPGAADPSGSATTGDAQTSDQEPEVQKIYYHADDSLDFEALAAAADTDEHRRICEYLSNRTPAAFNKYTGLLSDCNLIYICGEGFSPYALNEKVTPVLTKMASSGIVLSNYYTSYKNTTTNGEFALASGLWADVSRYAADGNGVGSFARSYDKLMPYGLGTVFEKKGIPSFAYHGYISSYYRRGDSWPNLGFSTIKFMNEGLSFTNYWSPSDLELMEQSVDDYIDKDRFAVYYMTYSGHGDYTPDNYMYIKNHQKVIELLGEDAKYYSDSEIAFLCGNYELEQAVSYLTDRLTEAGKLDNTFIVLAGDHIPYYFTWDEMKDMAAKNELPFDTNFEMYHSTCIMYNPSIVEPIINDNYCCNVDVLPTVYNLMGIDYDSRLFMGVDVFSNDIHRARLYNGNFITKYVKYNATNAKADWSDLADSFSDSQKEIYLNNLIALTENEYTFSIQMMDSDFYRYIFTEDSK